MSDLYETEAAEGSKCLPFLRLLWKFFRCIFSHVALVSMVVAYCVLGAYAFESLEADHEIQVKESIKYVRSNVTKRIWTITEKEAVLIMENWTDKVVKELVRFETELLEKMKKDGWDGTEEVKNIQWTFAGALFYSIIVITTIGYGHIAPKTQNGKVVTIFYAILGIPLMLLCLSNIGDVMATSFRFLYWKICCYVCTRPPKPPRRRHMLVRSQSLRQPGRYAAGGSFRRPIRSYSQRSADSSPSAFSENVTTRLSDIDCNNRGPSRNLAPPGQRSVPSSMKFRAENSSGKSPSRTKYELAAGTRSLDRKARLTMPSKDDFFVNKYATDIDGGINVVAAMSQESRRCRSVDPNSGDIGSVIEMVRPVSVGGGRRNNGRFLNKREASSARIMSPMGFAVHRQIYMDDYSVGFGSGDQEPDDPATIKPVPIWLCVFLVLSYILGGTFLFAEWESWPYLDSAYFCFITLTTIGFGDLVPAHRLNAHQGIALCSLYLLFGIALLAMSFNLVQEEVINNVKSVAKRLGIIKEDHGTYGDEDDEEEDDESDEYADREDSYDYNFPIRDQPRRDFYQHENFYHR